MGRLPDGLAVFVPFGLPGERVRIHLVEEKRGFARGALIEVIQPSPQRIEAHCAHFFSRLPAGVQTASKACGGCHYQHLSYEEQLTAKAEILRDQLQRIGKIEAPPMQATVPSPQPWNYRNHMQFHLTAQGQVGFFNAAGNQVIDIAECHLPELEVNAFWPQLAFEPGMKLERVSVRSGLDQELMVTIESGQPETPELEVEADISVTHIFDEHVVVMAGEDHLVIPVLGANFRVSAGSFFQVNTKMAEKMVSHLLDRLPVNTSSILLDVYCGVGLFSKFFAPKCAQVIGIESSASACEDFGFNLDEFENVDLYEGPAEDVLPHLQVRPEIVIVDPPRAGLEKPVVDGLLKLGARTIAYVSCDPSTLARDLGRLIAGGYHLTDVTPFDMFPQTYHIESISILEKN